MKKDFKASQEINKWEKKQEAQLFQEELIAMMSTMLMSVISKENETKAREIKNWWIDECDRVRKMMNTKKILQNE